MVRVKVTTKTKVKAKVKVKVTVTATVTIVMIENHDDIRSQLEEKNVNTILFVGNSKLEALIKSKNKYCDHFSNKWEDNIKTILN